MSNSYAGTCPCKICTKRHLGCHSKCDLYIGWKDDNDYFKEKARLERDGYTDHDSQPFWRKHRKDARSKRGQ